MRSTLNVILLSAALACQPAAQGDADTPVGDGPSSSANNAEGRVADSGSVMLALDKAAYDPGAPVTMSISSQRTDTLGYNPCSDRSIERETAGGWVVHPEPGRMCTMELRLLMPGETQTAQTTVPADVGAGTYRIVLRLRPERVDSAGRPSDPIATGSAPFRVPAS